MKRYIIRSEMPESRRAALTITLRKAGFSAYLEDACIVTNATLFQIALTWGTAIELRPL
jgi:hypothetical protein